MSAVSVTDVRRLRTRRRLERATAQRMRLILLLSLPGARPSERLCAICGRSFEVARLEIDHVGGKLWRSNRLSPHMRIVRCWREYRSGVKLRVACKPCNARDSAVRTNAKRARAAK